MRILFLIFLILYFTGCASKQHPDCEIASRYSVLMYHELQQINKESFDFYEWVQQQIEDGLIINMPSPQFKKEAPKLRL